ncbi:CoA pyrophosphatase [Pontibacter sp. G13]|uniref:NUDIX hydrolase n=1 Tax=Pontibacter sp. G13 TaxID=3074898 RepID=UPI00288ADB2A|nr:CoA pyrophosphatase [Pontibacter sp. G13]WNJ16289.1 CoA pyrophosphatase [Pontibacter sp. G13]
MIEFSQLVLDLKHRLTSPLPGLDAQMIMAPEIRGRDVEVPADARLCSVMVLLYPHEDAVKVAFMKRSEDGRVHSGQVCFPGGRRDPVDTDQIATALREADEELGIKPDEIEVLGEMTELYIPPSNSLVYPVLSVSDTRPAFAIDPIEVAQVIEVDLEELLDDSIKGMHTVDVFGGNFIEAPGYTVQSQHLIWGGTSMMIAELVEIIRQIRVLG